MFVNYEIFDFFFCTHSYLAKTAKPYFFTPFLNQLYNQTLPLSIMAQQKPVAPKKKRNFNISPYIEPRDIAKVTDKTGNIYESINVVSRRANQIAVTLKEELYSKLNEFASTTDSLEEVHENKEQIEISRYYERLPHASLLSFEEFMADKLQYRLDKTEPDALR